MDSHIANVRWAKERERQSRRGQESPVEFRGNLTGKGYQSFEEMQHFESREAQRRSPIPAEEERLAKLSPDEIRAEYNQKRQAEQEQGDDEANGVVAEIWRKLHPEYLPCAENVKQMFHYLNDKGMTGVLTVNDLEDAFDDRNAKGLLRLNQTALQQIRDRKIQEIAREIEAGGGIRSYGPTEGEMHTMSLGELRAREMKVRSASAR